MDETRFRSLMHDAVGEEPMRPWLNNAVRARVAQPVPSAFPTRWMALVAAGLAVAIVAFGVAPRLLNRVAHVVPATTPSALATPTAAVTPSPEVTSSPAAALSCTLPLIVYDQTPGPDPTQPWEGGSQSMRAAGFVDARTGRFTADGSASRAEGMPVDPIQGAPPPHALAYSPATKRWIPVGPERMSPDGESYAYMSDIYGRTLTRYDIVSGKRVPLWHAPVQIGIIRWTAAGILVGDATPGGS